ncbi:MAG: polysaccharide deacetylase family protein [Christensenellaceae bacterium]
MIGRRSALTAGLLSIALALSVCLSSGGSAAVFFGDSLRSLPIYAVETEEKKISISFDCAWGTDHTDAILAALAAEDVRSTFFMVQFWAEKYPEYVKKIDESGQEIGTHSRTHSYMSKLSAAEIEDELTTSSAAISAVTGKRVELFRPPYGDYDNELIDTAGRLGYFTIQWDVDSLDWKDLSAGEIASRIISRVKPGSIILCHNNGLHTAEALPVVLSTLKQKGYTFVPIGELIFRKNYTINSNGIQKLVELS